MAPYVLTAEELMEQGWSFEEVIEEAARVEFSQFGSGAYSAAELKGMLNSPGGLCVFVFAAEPKNPQSALGFAICVERRARDGKIAQQLVSIAIKPTQTGQGLGLLLDERCEAIARQVGYRLRVLRSRAPSSIYAKYAGREGGSPHGEATRFALKRGFQVMSEADARNFFENDVARFITEDLVLGDKEIHDCQIAESHPQGENPPWYFICMMKAC